VETVWQGVSNSSLLYCAWCVPKVFAAPGEGEALCSPVHACINTYKIKDASPSPPPPRAAVRAPAGAGCSLLFVRVALVL
jgi:hypothetical protein